MTIRNIQIEIMELIILDKSNILIKFLIPVLNKFSSYDKYINLARKGFSTAGEVLSKNDLNDVINYKLRLENDIRRR